MFAANKIFTILFVLVAFMPLSTMGFSLTAILNRRGKVVKPAAPSQALQDFNAQMAAIVAEERRDHYYPYVQQTSAFLTNADNAQDAMPSSTSSY